MALFELTGFQRDLMFVIAPLEKPSGQHIKGRMEDATDRDVNHGRLYPNLDTLVEKGFVEQGDINRRTNYYELTQAGQQALDERRAWQAQHHQTNRLADD